VYSYCDAGHLVSRRCSDPAGACGTCAEIRRVQEEERRRVEELVRKHEMVMRAPLPPFSLA
jgi:hypothetical protein